MTNKNREDVLKKAIEKAVKNGFEQVHGFHFGNMPFEVSYEHEYTLFRFIDDERRRKQGDRFVPEELIFSHEFAKAFFGEECALCPTRAHIAHIPNWQYHLQQLVLEQDPLEYIEKYL